jgi:hypothetical protein
MTRTPFILALAAAAALAGCSKENHTIVAEPGGDSDTNAASNQPVELPPSIVDSKIYRCADNRVVYVDWLSDNKSANVRTEKGGTPTQVTAAEPGKALTAAGGYELEGAAKASTVKIAVPGHGSQSCKA